MKKLILALLILTIFAGCAFALEPAKGDETLKTSDILSLVKKYPIPDMQTGALKFAEPDPSMLAKWWEAFNDPTLTELIEYALKNSRDLNIARSKVIASRAGLAASRARFLPWFSGFGSYQRGRNSQDTYPDAQGAVSNVYSLGVDASWEIDLFGGRSADTRAAKANVQAQYAQLYNAWVSLSAEIAMQYITLRTSQYSLAVAQDNYKLQEQTYQLVSSRHQAGLIDELALKQAKYSMEKVKALIPPFKITVEETKNRLALLVGKIPGELEEKLNGDVNIPFASGGVLYGIPANMLRQRPDIQAAERNLAAAFAKRQSAQADLWPKLYLNGTIGTEALTGDGLFTAATRNFGFGPALKLPIFQWGAIKSNIIVQTEAEKQALYAYEKTVLNAIAEVRNALESSVQKRERTQSLKDGFEAAKAALEIAEDKYKAGLVTFDPVINAQESLRALSQAYVISRGEVSISTIQLFKALGGGWQPIDEELAKKK